MARIRFFCFFVIIFSCAGSSPAEERVAKEVVCFIYHRFGDSRYPSTNTPVADFEAHLSYLAKHDYQVLTFSDAIDYLNSAKPARKTAVITIDDGYKTFFSKGLPLLRKYGMPATLFINTKSVGNGVDFMTWGDLKQCLRDGIEVGNHTHSHDYFLNEASATRYETFRKEINQCQTIIRENLGVTPTVFSFPYGEFDLKMKAIAEEAGFKAAAAQRSGVLYTGMDLFQCPRFPMSEAYSSREKFIEKASMAALKVRAQQPSDFILPADHRPSLEMTFDADNLRLDQLQCFVQGGTCTLRMIDKTKVSIAVQSKTRITGRRRTLYTVTVPDKNGIWHWYSHLWINTAIAGER